MMAATNSTVSVSVTIDQDVQARSQAPAGPDKDFAAFLAEAARDALARRAAGRAEMQAMLDGPRHSHAESMAEMRRNHSLPDSSPLSAEELEAQGDALLDAMPPEKIAEAG